MIKIDIQMKLLQERVASIRGRIATKRPFMQSVAGIMLNAVKTNFQAGGRPPWKPSKRVQEKGGQTLIRSGMLLRSLQSRATEDKALVGTNMPYAAIHQFGGKTKAHVIQARRARALFWPGAKHPVKSVNHPGSTIPPRPFLALTDADKQDILAAAKTYLEDKP